MPSILLDGERAVLADRSGALLMKLRTVGLLQIMVIQRYEDKASLRGVVHIVCLLIIILSA